MHERCARLPDGATQTCERNSGLAERVRVKIQNAAPKGLALDIEDMLCGAVCLGSIRDQVSNHHHARLTLDVTVAACQCLPRHVTEAILADVLGPIGYVAVRIPERAAGDTMSALADAGAEMGDVHRVVPAATATREQKLREINEAIQALQRVAAGLP